jgi:hypothetical protein
MHSQIQTTTRHLGELAAMSRQTEAAERRILEVATKRLADVQDDIAKTRPAAITTHGDAYMALIQERGQLNQVIAQARRVLAA